jgi:hypothetical protein
VTYSLDNNTLNAINHHGYSAWMLIFSYIAILRCSLIAPAESVIPYH